MTLSPIAPSLSRFALRLTAATAAAALLVSCGGGGGYSGGGAPSGLPSSSSLAQYCFAPRPAGTLDPFTNRPYGDIQGSLANEKDFLRSWIDETYLWYLDVEALPAATLDASASATPLVYFDKLKTPLTTASGKPKDQFHFTYPTPAWVALATAGVSYGYGLGITLAPAKAPNRNAIVAFLEPGATPASANALARGAAILTVDGVDVANGTDLATLNEGLFPTAAAGHTFTIRDFGLATTRNITMTAQAITETPVQFVKTLPAPNSSVGYMLFNDHIATSEAALVSAVNTLKAARITDLVLDVRYNGGGFLDIAAELAYMIAGPAATTGKVFEQLTFNNRNPFPASSTPFWTTGHFGTSNGTALPNLGLSRVFVLTTGDTCSASEAIINGLEGANITVHRIGGTTCGKPYGFYPRDNCNTTYFAIQFQGMNNKGFGDYADGFTPTCVVADDFSRALGDPLEDQLEVALAFRNNGGTCVPPTSARLRGLGTNRSVADAPTGPALARSPFRENRIYRAQ